MSPVPVATESALDPENLQAGLLKLILRVSALLGTLVYLPSVYTLLKQGSVGVVAIDTAALAAVFALLGFDRLSFRWRARAVCFIYYALGVGLLISVGSVSQIYLFAFSVVTVLLLGVRMGVGAAVVSSVSLLAVGALGNAATGMTIPNSNDRFTEWVVITINFALVNTLLTLAVGTVLGAVTRALKRETASRISLDHERKLLRTLIDTLPDVVFTKDAGGRFVKANAAGLALYGFDREDQVAGKTVFDLLPPALAASMHADDEEVMAGRTLRDREERRVDASGKSRWYLTTKVLLHDAAGAAAGFIGVSKDITERRRLEEQLRQSQKMDAVGQLAGGVAHDFNNLLSVILSYCDLMMIDLASDDPMRQDVEEIQRAGSRAAELTRQLLMFSHQQIVQPKVLDLNDVLAGVDKMLRRVVGEDVELTSVPCASLWHVRADPGSIEQIIMNLAVNARDAMPVGGKLTMETANVTLDEAFAMSHFGSQPGAYVMLSVTDTGSGMDKATLAHIFEPFFTTKEKGKGTGLGLSTVFGIVKQSGGTVWVYSELGMGTTFKVYLPRVVDDIDDALPLAATGTLRGSETVLLVEDEDQVRCVTRGILLRHGYTVLDAGGASDAIALCERHVGRIHLLLSDVVMPKMSGPALAKRLTKARPDMKVLCMSGYTDDAAVRHGVIDAELAYLQKPITVDALTRKVRSVLDAS